MVFDFFEWLFSHGNHRNHGKFYTTQHLNSFNRAEGTCLYFCAFRAFCVTFNL